MHDLACPFCGGSIEHLRCSVCCHNFPPVLGLPFLGAYQCDDILGLIEIAANIPNRKTLGLLPATVDEIEGLCEAYHASGDRVAFLDGIRERHGPYFLNRYAEWQEIHELTNELDLNGKAVLDIGAGVGYDSYRLARKGAVVTAMEFSPILMEVGADNFPDIRWIGGLAHALPFADASFDAVFFNAALHHMRELPTVIFEALRVLRDGGVLVTTCDSFRPDHVPVSQELQIFDTNEAVLLGVNEQIPRFKEFTETLLKNPDCVSVELYTHMVYGGLDGQGTDITDFRKWELSDFDMLRQRSGSLAMRVRKLKPLPGPRGKIEGFALLAEHYASLLTDQAKAISSLAGLIPGEYVNRKISAQHTKFDLLNGWRMPQEKQKHRRVFKRGRWFMRRRFSKAVNLKVRSHSPATFVIILDGAAVHRFEAKPGWNNLSINIKMVPARKPFALEIQRETPAENFDDAHFDVKHLSVSNPIDRLVAG